MLCDPTDDLENAFKGPQVRAQTKSYGYRIHTTNNIPAPLCVSARGGGQLLFE